MILVCRGRTYSTAQMRLFRTTDPAVPYIYLTFDGRSTFVIERDPDGTLAAHRAGTGEIIALSRRYQIEGLLGAFPAVFAPADILPGGAGEDEEMLSGAFLGSGEGVPPGARG